LRLNPERASGGADAPGSLATGRGSFGDAGGRGDDAAAGKTGGCGLSGMSPSNEREGGVLARRLCGVDKPRYLRAESRLVVAEV